MALTPPQQVGLNAIKQAAAAHNVDWRVMAALAHHESNLTPTAMGDGGHAVGLFQLNNAGGVLTGKSPQEFASYANADKNADYAATALAKLGIVKGSGTVAGQIAQGVNRFERPANKQGEIDDATAWYRSTLAGSNPNAVGTPSGGSVAATSLTGGTPQTVASGQVIQNPATTDDSARTALLSYVMNQNAGVNKNPGAPSLLATLSAPQVTQPQPSLASNLVAASKVAPIKTVKGSTTAPVSTGTGTGKDGYGLPLPATDQYKPLGTPYQGTHGKQFNEKGGSDNWESENAIDLGTKVGTPVYAVANGKIGSQIGSLGSGGRFAGQRVHLVTGDNEFYYAHLSKLAVNAGQTVQKGQLIGYSGSADGVAHLHIAAKTGNPETYFGYPK